MKRHTPVFSIILTFFVIVVTLNFRSAHAGTVVEHNSSEACSNLDWIDALTNDESVPTIGFDDLSDFRVKPGEAISFFIATEGLADCQMKVKIPKNGNEHYFYDESAQLFTYQSKAGTTGPVDVTFSLEADARPLSKTITLVPSTTTVENQEVFGFTEGSHAVNENGAFTYSMGIATPDGPAGIKPGLTLNYSSHGSDGIMGVGWSLGGLSTISKSPSFIDLDDKIRSIKNDGQDQFNLDGDRLIAINGGVVGGNGTEYRTENNNFSRIFSTAASNRVESWVVQTKSGLRYEYGTTDDSYINSGGSRAFFWAVNKIKDTYGNYIEFIYDKVSTAKTLEYYPLEIKYGANENEGTDHTTSIKFTYADRPDIKNRFVNGLALQNTKLLSKVEVFNNGRLMRTYTIAYHELSDTSTMSKLKSITESGADGGSYRPIEFEWVSNGNLGLESAGSIISSSRLKGKRIFPLDINSDGLQDMLLLDENNNQNYIYLNNDGQFNESAGSFPALAGKGRFIAGDYNADGHLDLFWYDKTKENSRFLLNQGDGSFAEGVSTTTDGLFNETDKNEIYAVDGNGDGFTDFLRFNKESLSTAWFKNLSTKDGFVSTFEFSSDNVENADIPANSDIYVNDFNGDGLADILFINQSNGFTEYNENITEAGSNSNDFIFKDPKTAFLEEYLNTDQGIYFGNWNGDNLLDIALINIKNGENFFFINEGDGPFEYYENPIATSQFNADNITIYPADWNGDGFTDIIVHDRNNGNNSFLLNEDNLNFSVSSQVKLPKTEVDNGSGLVLGDWTGTGVLSPMWLNISNGANLLFKNQIRNNNLITAVSNGAGQRISVDYSTLRDSEVYTPGSDGIYPNINFQGALSVVGNYSLNNGLGDTNTFSYHYSNGKINIQGRGFRGFEKVELTDHQTQVKTVNQYNRSYMLAGHEQVLQAQISAEGDTLGASYFTNASREIQGTHFSYVEKQVNKEFEVDGTPFKTVTQTFEYDDFGNATLVRLDFGNGFVDETLSEFDNVVDNERYHLGRLTKTTFRRKTQTSDFIDRVATFEYSPTTGSLLKETVEPDNDALRQVTSHTYDGFGNRTRTEVEGNNGNETTTRSSTYTMDVTGRYVVETVNSMGHKSTRTYDPIWGFVSRHTGPNQLSTEWTYDEFGRKTDEERADGTSMTKEYNWCESGNCPVNASYFTLTQESGIPDVYVYFDLLGREIRSSTLGFDGTLIHIDTEYDNLGNVSKKSEPYFEGNTAFWNEFEYDIKQRVVKSIEPVNRVTTVEYDGLTITTTNPLGQQEVMVYDVQGRKERITDDSGESLLLTHDAFGNLIRTEDPLGNIISWEYDNLGRNTKMTDPNLGEETYEFNTFGELVKKTNARGQSTSFEYDLLGRVVKRVEQEGTTLFTYDQGDKAVGQLSAINSFGVNTTIDYDQYGRFDSKTKDIGGRVLTFGTEYNENSQPEKYIYPGGFEIVNEYNERGYPSAVTYEGETIWQPTKVNARGQIEAQDYGNGSSISKTFLSETGWITDISASSADTTFQELTYTYNALGQLTSRESNTLSLKENFTYDNLNRLIRAKVDDQAPLDITYDAIGNITYKSDVGQYSYGEGGAGPQALTGIDAEGVDDWSLRWSLDNFVTYNSFQKAESIANDTASLTLTYDEAYQRIKAEKTIHGRAVSTKYYFDNWYELEDTNGELTYTYYIRTVEGVVAQYTKTDSEATFTYWYKDHLGSVETIASQDLSSITAFSYDAWGKRRNAETWVTYDYDVQTLISRGFTGHEHYDLLSLIDMNGRVYDPTLGRFLSPDPFIPDLDNIQAYNRYSYVINNPLNYTDPSGYFFSRIFKKFKKIVKNVVRAAVKVVKKVAEFVSDQKDIIIPIAVGLVTGGAGFALGPTFGLSAAISGAAGFGFGQGVSSALLGGASLGDALKAGVTSGLISGVSAYATAGVGNLFRHATDLNNYAIKALAHGSVQGVTAELSGGEFGRGFIVGAISSTSQLAIQHIPSDVGQITASVLVGGSISELSGGSFESGAVSAATIIIFNDMDAISRWTDEHVEVGLNFSGPVLPSEISRANVGLNFGANINTGNMFLVFKHKKISVALVFDKFQLQSVGGGLDIGWGDIATFYGKDPRLLGLNHLGGVSVGVGYEFGQGVVGGVGVCAVGVCPGVSFK